MATAILRAAKVWPAAGAVLEAASEDVAALAAPAVREVLVDAAASWAAVRADAAAIAADRAGVVPIPEAVPAWRLSATAGGTPECGTTAISHLFWIIPFGM